MKSLCVWNFFGDTVDEMRVFDFVTQRSVGAA